MIEEVGKYLYRQRISLREACSEAGVDYNEDMDTYPYRECDHCLYWLLRKELHKDRGGMLICKVCEEWYGN